MTVPARVEANQRNDREPSPVSAPNAVRLNTRLVPVVARSSQASILMDRFQYAGFARQFRLVADLKATASRR